jgi:arylsulfatase A-like enzyme
MDPDQPSQRRRHAAASLLALVALAFGAGCERAPRHLVLVTFDTTRADHLSAYGHDRPTSPALAALAERGVRFDDAIAQSIATPPSHASILTGKNPPRHGLRELWGEALARQQTTLAEVLSAHGFVTAAFVGAVPLVRNRGLDQGFALYDDDFPKGLIERRARKTNQRVRAWLASRPPGRLFLWVHYFDPHYPYLAPRSYQMKFAGRLFARKGLAYPANTNPETTHEPEASPPDAARVATMKDLYDAEVRYTDDALTELFALLDTAGILQDAVIAVVADHGESLGEHGYYFGHWDVFWENARVPMILARPDGRYAGRRIAETVRTVDLMPTLLAWLEIEAPGDLDGVDLTPLLEGEGFGEETAYTEQQHYTHSRAVRTKDWLLVRRDPRDGDAPGSAIHLYRRIDGRAVSEDVAAGHPDIRDRLAARLEELHDVDDPGETVPIPVTDSVREQLRALGYLPDDRPEDAPQR